MFKSFFLAVALLGALPWAVAQGGAAAPAPSSAVAPAQLELAIVKTAEAHTLEALTYSGGAYTKRVKLQHIAVLVRQQPHASTASRRSPGRHPGWLRPAW